MKNIRELHKYFEELSYLYKQLSLIEINTNKNALYIKKKYEITKKRKEIEKFFFTNFSPSVTEYFLKNYPYKHANSFDEIFLSMNQFSANDATYRRLLLENKRLMAIELSKKQFITTSEKFSYFDLLLDQLLVQSFFLFTFQDKNEKYITLKNHILFNFSDVQEHMSLEKIKEEEETMISSKGLSWQEYNLYKQITLKDNMCIFLQLMNKISNSQFLFTETDVVSLFYFLIYVVHVPETKQLIKYYMNKKDRYNFVMQMYQKSQELMRKLS